MGHSTETALLKVANDLLTAMDTGKVSVLILLDLSAAFDTVDYDILLHRLEHTFSFQGTTLAWFRSYLSGRTQIVSIDGRLSFPATIHCGFLQGSVLGSRTSPPWSLQFPTIISWKLPITEVFSLNLSEIFSL